MPFDYIPEQLRQIPNWLVYRTKDAPRGADGLRTGWQDRTGTFEKATQTCECMGFKLGFSFKDCQVFGIDIDSCIGPTGEIEEWAQLIIDRFPTYAEISGSGTGIKLIGVGDAKPRTRFMEGATQYGNHKPQFDIYAHTPAYFALTGNVLDGHWELADCTEALRWLDETHPDDTPDRTESREKSNGIASEREREYNAKHSIEEIVCQHGWENAGVFTKPGVDGNITRLKRPGKFRGVSAEVKPNPDGTERFFVYTTEGAPFKQWTKPGDPSYSAWQCNVLLNFDGDFSKAYGETYGECEGIKITSKAPERAAGETKNSQEAQDVFDFSEYRDFKPFPLDTFPPLAQTFIAECAKALDCDSCCIAVPLLSAVSGCLGNSYWVRVNANWVSPAMLWTAIIGRSGTAKSPAMKLVYGLLKSIESDYRQENHEARQEYERQKEEQKQAQRSKLDKGGIEIGVPPDPPVEKRLITNNATLEKLALMLAENPKGVLYWTPELASWVAMFTRYSSETNLNEWLQIFDGEPLNQDRKTAESVYVPRAFVAVCGGLQPKRIPTTFNSEAIDSGLTARVMYCYPPPKPRVLSEDVVAIQSGTMVEKQLRKLSQLPTNAASDPFHWEPDEIPLSRDAFHSYKPHHDELNHHATFDTDEVMSTVAKIVGNIPRIALIFHAFQDPEELAQGSAIDQDTMERATAVGYWFLHEAQRLHQIAKDQPGFELVNVIIGVLRQHGPCNVRKMRDHSRIIKKAKSETVEKACRQLVLEEKLASNLREGQRTPEFDLKK